VLYPTFAAKYRAQYTVYAMPSLFPTKSNKITFLDIEASIFNWTYLRRYCWYVDNSMRVILHICSQTQPKSSRLRCVKSGPSPIQYNYSSSYAGINIQLNVSPCDWWVIDNSMRVILHICCHTQCTSAGLRYVNPRARLNSMFYPICILKLL
jgi:hypothetical protein